MRYLNGMVEDRQYHDNSWEDLTRHFHDIIAKMENILYN